MNWQSTKLLVTIMVIVLSFIGLIAGKIGGSEWGTITVFALGIYATADVKQKEINNGTS